MGDRAVKITQQELTTGRVDFNKDAFDNLIHQKGLCLTHEQAMKCPCVREINGQGEPHCNSCNGSGYVFVEPCEIRGVVQAVGYNPKYFQYSEANLGIAMLTTRYDERIGWWDRITVQDGETIFIESIFPIVRKISDVEELSALLTYDPIVVVKVFMFIDSETPPLELEQFESDNITPKDFTIQGRRLKLSDAILASFQSASFMEGQPKKKYISIRYRHKPQYVVMDIQRDIRNTRQIEPGGVESLKNMPIHCTLKKVHYKIGDEGFGANAKPA